jgi:hypothetical protein
MWKTIQGSLRLEFFLRAYRKVQTNRKAKQYEEK